VAQIDVKQRIERRMLRLIDDSGLPAPDQVAYGDREVTFLWHDHKVAVIVDLDGTGLDDHHLLPGIPA
jgi:hypothetical protein